MEGRSQRNEGNYNSSIMGRHGGDDRNLINLSNFNSILNEKLAKHKLSPPNNQTKLEIQTTLNFGLETYMKAIIEQLIKIFRIRNISFDQLAKSMDRVGNVRTIY